MNEEYNGINITKPFMVAKKERITKDEKAVIDGVSTNLMKMLADTHVIL